MNLTLPSQRKCEENGRNFDMESSNKLNKSNVITAFANWIEPYNWQWFVTLTFAKSINSIIAKKLFTNFVNEIDRKAIYVLVVEWFRYKRNFVHIHSLIGNVKEFNPDKASKQWNRRYGVNKIEPYKKELGARFYLGKYLTEDLDWDIELGKQQDK